MATATRYEQQQDEMFLLPHGKALCAIVIIGAFVDLARFAPDWAMLLSALAERNVARKRPFVVTRPRTRTQQAWTSIVADKLPWQHATIRLNGRVAPLVVASISCPTADFTGWSD